MAFPRFRVENSTSNIKMIGDYVKAIISEENSAKRGHFNVAGLLRPDEINTIRHEIAGNHSDIEKFCKMRLSLGTEYYSAIRHQITSLLGLWDSVFERKRYYDTFGWQTEDRGFMDGFLICWQIIPERVNVGHLGPFISLRGLEPYTIDTTPNIHNNNNDSQQASNTVMSKDEDDFFKLLANETGFKADAGAPIQLDPAFDMSLPCEEPIDEAAEGVSVRSGGSRYNEYHDGDQLEAQLALDLQRALHQTADRDEETPTSINLDDDDYARMVWLGEVDQDR